MKIFDIFFKNKNKPITLNYEPVKVDEDLTLKQIKESIKKRNLLDLKKIIKNNLFYENNGDSLLHILFTNIYNLDDLNEIIDFLFNFKNCPIWFNENSQKYVPIQSLAIQNLKFYENNLSLVLPKLLTIYPKKTLNRIIYTSDDFFMYKEILFQYSEDEYLSFFLKNLNDGLFKSYPTFLNKNFDLRESLKLVPPQHIYQSIKKKESLEELTFELTLRKSKTFKKLVMDLVVNKKWEFLIKEVPHICKEIKNDDICLQFIHHYFKNYEDSFTLRNIPISNILNLISLTQFYKFFINNYTYRLLVKHTSDLMIRLDQIYNIRLNIKDFDNLKSFHDQLSRTIALQQRTPFNLNQDHLTFLDGKEIKNLGTIYIPKTNFDLIETGFDLNICIGSLGYEEKILLKKTNMLFFKKEKKVDIVVNFSNDFELIEAKKSNNRDLDLEETYLVIEFLKESKKKHLTF